MAIYNISGVLVGATKIGCIEQGSDIVLGSDVQAEPHSGAIYPQAVTLVAQQPRATFSTKAIKAGLDKFAPGFLGVSLASFALKLYGQLQADGAARGTGSVHQQFTANKGIWVPRTLSCEHQGHASLSTEAIVAYDGTNYPWVIDPTAILPAGFLDTERWALGAVTIGNIALTGLRRLEIDFGIDCRTEGSGSAIWDEHVSIRTASPVITLRGNSPTWLSAAQIPIQGRDCTHGNTTIYLRRRGQGQAFTGERILITAAGLAVIDSPYSASGDSPVETSLRLVTKDDGANAPLVINTVA